MATPDAHPFDRLPALREAIERYHWARVVAARLLLRQRTLLQARQRRKLSGVLLSRRVSIPRKRPAKVVPDAAGRVGRGRSLAKRPRLRDRGTRTRRKRVGHDVLYRRRGAGIRPRVLRGGAGKLGGDARRAAFDQDRHERRSRRTRGARDAATIRTDASAEAYVADVDAWLDLLSALGLFVSDCSLAVAPPTVEDWERASSTSARSGSSTEGSNSGSSASPGISRRRRATGRRSSTAGSASNGSPGR